VIVNKYELQNIIKVLNCYKVQVITAITL